MTKFHWPGFDSLGKLSADETVEFAAQAADLTRSGLPLAEGLRAMADELSGRRTRRTLHAMADRLDAGDDLAAAVESQGRWLPLCLRGVVLAGLRSGRLTEVLEEYADLRRGRLELRHRVWLAVAYPLFLLCALALVTVLGRYFLVAGFETLFQDHNTVFDDDFDIGLDAKLPAMTKVALKASGPFAWFMVSLAAICVAFPLLMAVAPGARWLWPVWYKLPMIGPLLRWGSLAQFSRLTALLLEQQSPLPDALRLTAAGLDDPHLARGCRRAAEDVERGEPLAESMDRRRQFPACMTPLVEWGQRTPALADAFRAAAEMFEGRAIAQGALLEAVLLPIMLLLIVTLMGFYATSVLLPLRAIIETMSKWL